MGWAIGMFAEEVANYSELRGMHRSGGLGYGPLAAIERHCRNPSLTMETGCGASTVLMSNISPRHYAFCFDDRIYPTGSVNFVTESPLYRATRSTFVFGPTQQTLPSFQFDDPIDFALIDGPHAFPFPELEYYTIYPRLKVAQSSHSTMFISQQSTIFFASCPMMLCSNRSNESQISHCSEGPTLQRSAP